VPNLLDQPHVPVRVVDAQIGAVVGALGMESRRLPFRPEVERLADLDASPRELGTRRLESTVAASCLGSVTILTDATCNVGSGENPSVNR